MFKFNKKMSVPQILFTSIFVSMLATVSDSFKKWDSPIYHGIYAGALCLIVIVIPKVIFKDK